MEIRTDLLESVKKNEGFRAEPYKDHLGYLTIGYGTLLENGITKEEAEALLKIRLTNSMVALITHRPVIKNLSVERQDVIYEMGYQLGVSGVLKFNKMWYALEREDYDEAAIQMLDSKWSQQTPGRASKLAEIMKTGWFGE